MKKVFSLIIILALAGFTYWFFLPSQQVTRKAKRVLKLYTVSEESSRAGNVSSSIFLDSLFTENIEIDVSKELTSILSRLNRSSISREHLTIGHQNLTKYVSKLEHTAGKFTVTEAGKDLYTVTFPHTIELKKGILAPTFRLVTTFTFKKEDDSLKISKISLR